MPKYNLKIVCPVSSSHKDRTTQELKISQGIISQVAVTWSHGSQFLSALVVRYDGAQIIPAEGGGECRGNGDIDAWPEYIEIDVSHPKVTVEVWNEGNDNEQEVLFSIVVLPAEPSWITPIREFVDMFRRLIGA